jgi:hypothetical protein
MPVVPLLIISLGLGKLETDGGGAFSSVSNASKAKFVFAPEA